MVVLNNCIDADTITAFRSAHSKLLDTLQPQFSKLQREVQGDEQSFYKGEQVGANWLCCIEQQPLPLTLSAPPLQNIDGLRLRTTAPGRFDLKSIGSRDCGTFFSTGAGSSRRGGPKLELLRPWP